MGRGSDGDGIGTSCGDEVARCGMAIAGSSYGDDSLSPSVRDCLTERTLGSSSSSEAHIEYGNMMRFCVVDGFEDIIGGSEAIRIEDSQGDEISVAVDSIDP